MIPSQLRRSLICPRCRGGLQDFPDCLRCPVCGVDYPVVDGIPSLVPEPESSEDSGELDMTLMILARNEEENLRHTLSEARRVLDDLGIRYEVLVVDGGSRDGTREVAASLGARVHPQTRPGYGNAFREGLEQVRGAYLLTLDADLSHDPNYIQVLWQRRHTAELLVGSRYVAGGEALMPLSRQFLSRVLNKTFGGLLSVPVADLSSGFRLYKSSVLRSVDLQGRDFDILIELLVEIFIKGYRVAELPMFYKPRGEGQSNAQLRQFATSYGRALWRLWRARNSLRASDYDSRAFHSLFPVQRYWQRQRYAKILQLLEGRTSSILDVGCGSSKIIQSLPGAVGVDCLARKLRYLRSIHPQLVHADIFQLPFADATFETVICSQVIDRIPDADRAVAQLVRVLKPGGCLILGSPDYGTWTWKAIYPFYKRMIPDGNPGKGNPKLNREDLLALLERHGLKLIRETYVGGGEWIGLARRPKV